MRDNHSRLTNLFLVSLAIVFAVGLTFATLEAPRVLDRLLSRFIDVPEFHPAIEPDAIEEWMNSHHVRAIGYVCLGLLIVLIIAGFVSERTGLSTVGTLGFFLPTFGYFATYMFFLGGLGILRVAWLPIWGPSKDLLKLGDIVYLPYAALVYPFALAGVDVRASLIRSFIGLGLFVFLMGTIGWLQAKFRGQGTADLLLYRYSRHPQYLGWLIWSYGMMLLAARVPVVRAGENPGASLPWLISSLLVIAVAWSEEIKMSKERGEEYERYREAVPFMLPLPWMVTRVASAPMRLLLGTNQPRSKRQILAAVVVYGGLLIALSLPFVLWHWPPGPNGWFEWPYNVWPLHNRPPMPSPPVRPPPVAQPG